MLTTLDNPYNPWTQFDEWNTFDMANGYNTLALIARLSKYSIDFNTEEQLLAMDEAVTRILALNVTGNYVKVEKDTFKVRAQQPITN